jgi:hypothetical protein
MNVEADSIASIISWSSEKRRKFTRDIYISNRGTIVGGEDKEG